MFEAVVFLVAAFSLCVLRSVYVGVFSSFMGVCFRPGVIVERDPA
jgi:hypothetical protein